MFKVHGAKVATTIRYITEPDFIVDWLGEEWIVSVKIGDPSRPKVLRDAFVQYIDHMKDTGIGYGMIIFYPEEIRKVRPVEEEIERAPRET